MVEICSLCQKKLKFYDLGYEHKNKTICHRCYVAMPKEETNKSEHKKETKEDPQDVLAKKIGNQVFWAIITVLILLFALYLIFNGLGLFTPTYEVTVKFVPNP